jgi:S-adenosylmethionine/arginine decarboxylase-like enzyme
LDVLEKVSKDLGLINIQFITYDVRKDLDARLIGSYDVVITDPPYTRSGIELFLNRCSQAVKKFQSYDSSYILLFYGNSFKTPEKFLKIQELINSFGLVIEDKIDKFARYYGADSIGSASSLYLLKTTPFSTWKPETSLNKNIYTYESQKVEKFPFVDHITAKVFNVPHDKVKSKAFILKAMGEFCNLHKLKVLDRKETEFKNGGLSITFILSTSNLLAHTWPENNAVHIDLLTCSPIHNKTGIYQSLSKLFDTKTIDIRHIE